MPTIQKFEDLEVWKKARSFTQEIYACSKTGPFAREFPLQSQIRRAAVSIMSNIAEGFERDGNKEFLQFLTLAKGSCGEARSQLYIALDQNYIDPSQFELLAQIAVDIGRMLGGFMRYLQNSGVRGNKFKATNNLKPETRNQKLI